MLIVDLYLVWKPNQSFVPFTILSVNHKPHSVLEQESELDEQQQNQEAKQEEKQEKEGKEGKEGKKK